MRTTRLLLFAAGLGIVLTSLALFFFAGGLNRWVPVSLLGAGILMIIGIAVLTLADEPSVTRQYRTTEAPARYVVDERREPLYGARSEVVEEEEETVEPAYRNASRPTRRRRVIEEDIDDEGAVTQPTRRRRIVRRREM